MMPTIHLLTVHNNIEKRHRVRTLVYKHFQQNQRVLVIAPSLEALKFVDLLLWQMPPDQFLPHAVSQEPIQAAVVLTTQPININQAQVVLNLCGQACPIVSEFECVYELDDQSDPAKAKYTLEKRRVYAEAGLTFK